MSLRKVASSRWFAPSVTAALALACLVPASGLFRYLWENIPDV